MFEPHRAVEAAKEIAHPARVNAHRHREILRNAIGFAFLLATVSRNHSLAEYLYASSGPAITTCNDGAHRPQNRCQPNRLRANVPLRSVSRRNVPDFVAEHIGEFRFRIRKNQQASRNINVSARKCECVWGVHFDDVEVVVELAAGSAGRHCLPKFIEIRNEFGVRDQPHELGNFEGFPFVDLALFFLRHQNHFALAADGINRAGELKHEADRNHRRRRGTRE